MFMNFSKENQALCAAMERIEDIIEATQRKYEAHFSTFIDAETVFALKNHCRVASDFDCAFFGGYSQAERCMFGAWPTYEEETLEEKFPIELIRIATPPQKTLSHRDCLGALLGLGLKREMLGDILCDERVFYVFASAKIADYIINNLNKVGSAGVKVQKMDLSLFVAPEPKTQSKGIFVMSNRLDAIISGVLDLSRAKAADLIHAEKVSVNHALKTEVSVKVNEGDLISIRGFGRYRVGAEGSQSRKGRTYIEIIKYI